MDVIISLVKFYSNIRYYHGQRNVSKLLNKLLHAGISFVLKEDTLNIFFFYAIGPISRYLQTSKQQKVNNKKVFFISEDISLNLIL